MKIPIVFVLFLILLGIFQLKLLKSDRSVQQSKKRFWEYEENSLFTRKSPLPSELFIQPMVQNLPRLTYEEFTNLGNSNVYELQESTFELATKPMINLTHMLNSEVRHQYGTSQLKLIEDYEETYLQYIKNLYLLGKFYSEKGLFSEALVVLEEGLNVQTEIVEHLILLGNLYCVEHNAEKFSLLLETVQNLKSLSKDKIILKLEILKEANF